MSRLTLTALGLLILRVGFASMMLFGHGLPKLMKFSDLASSFADPLGVGHLPSLCMALVGEVVCTTLLALGYYARFAALGAAVTMGVAAGIVHAGDPFGKKELALAYGLSFVALALVGPGRWSLDGSRGRA